MSDAKPLALLVPGLDGTGLLFYRQVEPLSSRYRVLPWSFLVRSRFEFTDLVAELNEGVSREAPGPIVLVGESFGGVIAMHFALAFPERIRLLALINTFPYYRGRIRLGIGLRLLPGLRWKTARDLKDRIVDRILAVEGIHAEDRRRYREIVQRVDRGAYRRRLELSRSVDLRSRLGSISSNTILFASGRDRLVPSVQEAEWMASQIPNARLHVFPRAGHALLLTPGFSLADYF